MPWPAAPRSSFMLILSLCRALRRLTSPLEGAGVVLSFINGDRRPAVGSLPRASVLRRGWLAIVVVRPDECGPGASPLPGGALAPRGPPLLLRTLSSWSSLVPSSGAPRAWVDCVRSDGDGSSALLPLRGALLRRDPPMLLAVSFGRCASAEGETCTLPLLPGERWTLTPRTFTVRYRSVTLQHVLAGVCACVPSL